MKYSRNKFSLAFLLLCLLSCCSLSFTGSAAVTVAGSFAKGKESGMKSKKDCLVFTYGDWDKLSTKMFTNCWKNTSHLNKTLEANTVVADVKVYQFPTEAQKREMERRSNEIFRLDKADRFFLAPCQPSVIFIDATGFPYAILSGAELPDDPEKFAQVVGDLQRNRIARDEVLASAMKAKGQERAHLIRSASEVHRVKPDNQRFAELVKACDPKDELGYYRRFTFDIFELHTVMNDPKDEAIKKLDDELYKPGLSKEQQQMVYGLRGKILRNNMSGTDDAAKEELRANYQRMLELDPDTVMGKSARNALWIYCGVGSPLEPDNSGDEDKSIYLDEDE